MSPKSAQSRHLAWQIHGFQRSSMCAMGILLLCLTAASALTHIAVSGTVPTAYVSQPYNAQIGTSGGSVPFNFVIDSGTLPPGLNLNAATGAISGTPTTAGNYSFHVGVTGSGGAAHGDKWITLKVANGTIAVSVSPASASLNSGVSQQFTAYVTGTSNTAVTWSASKGTISSSGLFLAPNVTTTTSATVIATSVANPLKSSSAAVTITVPSGLSITTTSLPGGTTGAPYSAALAATGGTLPYVWSISSGSLPSGISLDSSTGIMSGNPGAQGTYSFSAKVTDAQGGSNIRALNISVTPNSGSKYDGPAELPRVYVQSTMANTPAPGATIQVSAGGDFQAALNSANCGDTIQLQAGATFTGNFILPTKSCNDTDWIIIRTSAPDTALPPEGTRITPCYAGVASLPGRPPLNCSSTQKVMATLMALQTGGPIRVNAGANHYRLGPGLEMTRPAGTGINYGLFTRKDTTAPSDHLIFDRDWVHGTARDDTAHGVLLTGITYAGIVDSYFNDFHCTAIVGACTDSQTVAGGSGSVAMGTWKIVNNFLEAAAENILFGGGGAGSATPADIEIRRNHMFKPLIWMPGQPGFVGGVKTDPKCVQFNAPGYCPFIVKNHFELKNATRVLFEANILENTWGGFTQHGFSIALTPRSYVAPGTSSGLCPTCQVTDITIRYSTISHTGGGIVITNPMSGNPAVVPALYGERHSIHDVTIDDVSAANYKGNGTLFLVGNAWPTNVLNSVSINHITGFPDPNGVLLTLNDPTSYPKMWGFSFTNNIVVAGRYPLHSVGGTSNCVMSPYPILILPSCFSTYSFSSNALIATPSYYPPSKWPSGNYFPVDATAVQFVNYNSANGGNYQLLPSSPYKNSGSDGKDLGADVAAIQAATAGVR